MLVVPLEKRGQREGMKDREMEEEGMGENAKIVCGATPGIETERKKILEIEREA